MSAREWLSPRSPETTLASSSVYPCRVFSRKTPGRVCSTFSESSAAFGQFFGWSSCENRQERIRGSQQPRGNTSRHRWTRKQKTNTCRCLGKPSGHRPLFGPSLPLSFLRVGDSSRFKRNCRSSSKTSSTLTSKSRESSQPFRTFLCASCCRLPGTLLIGYASKDIGRRDKRDDTSTVSRSSRKQVKISKLCGFSRMISKSPHKSTVCMLLAAFFLHPAASVTFITLGVALASFAYSSFSVNYLGKNEEYSLILGSLIYSSTSAQTSHLNLQACWWESATALPLLQALSVQSWPVTSYRRRWVDVDEVIVLILSRLGTRLHIHLSFQSEMEWKIIFFITSKQTENYASKTKCWACLSIYFDSAFRWHLPVRLYRLLDLGARWNPAMGHSRHPTGRKAKRSQHTSDGILESCSGHQRVGLTSRLSRTVFHSWAFCNKSVFTIMKTFADFVSRYRPSLTGTAIEFQDTIPRYNSTSLSFN